MQTCNFMTSGKSSATRIISFFHELLSNHNNLSLLARQRGNVIDSEYLFFLSSFIGSLMQNHNVSWHHTSFHDYLSPYKLTQLWSLHYVVHIKVTFMLARVAQFSLFTRSSKARKKSRKLEPLDSQVSLRRFM